MFHQDRFTPFAFFALLVAASGGLLFGYHTVILAGILDHVKSEFKLSDLDQGFLVSVVLLGGLVGALFAGSAADRWGRKKILVLTAALFCIGTLIQATSYTYLMLFCGRFLTGIAVGISSVVSPVYLAEVAPPHRRGSFVSTYQLLVAGGILLAYAIDFVFEQHSDWRLVFYIGFIPSFLQLMCLFFIPETPGWLLSQMKTTTAIDSLKHLREDKDWVGHLGEMEQVADPQKKMKLEPHLKRLLVIGLLLSIFQQITGVNTVFYYAPKIFAKEATASPLLVTLVIGVAGFLSTILSIIFLDRLGRRVFLLAGVSAMLFGQILLIFSVYSPLLGIIGALSYVVGFAIGLGPILWVLLSEIYPLHIRGRAMGIALFANWLFNYLISLTFLLLLNKLGFSGTFGLYSIFSILCLLFVYFFIPETKGKSLEEIEILAREGKL
jgi:SP family galactose:H+ symporter-like MFS transporter